MGLAESASSRKYPRSLEGQEAQVSSQPDEREDPEIPLPTPPPPHPHLSELPPQAYPCECKERKTLLLIGSETFSLLSFKVKYLAHAREYIKHDQEMNSQMCTQPSTVV